MDEQSVSVNLVEGTRPRNILTLEERVRAIREFDRRPVYQQVADIMNCSAKQIRNIVLNRDSILLYYASKTGECRGRFSKNNDRQQKIELLNRVMYEWIQRTQSRDDIGRISTKLIRSIALDVKNHLKVPSFYPNSAWLESFMSSYDMTEHDLLSQKVYERSTEPKEHLSLKISDIVDDVKQMDNRSKKNGMNNKHYLQQKEEMKFENTEDDNSLSMLYDTSNSAIEDNYEEEVQVVIDDDDDDEDEDDDNDEVDEDEAYLETPQKVRKIETKKIKGKTANEDKFIDSYEEALRHLKPLEDFVLLEENFRAIGVISQLEAIFRNPQKFQTE